MTTSTQNQTDCLIVGAGIAGLLAADVLQKAGRSVIVLDKGRGVGGRMATRRIENGRIDHGAQFFTVRSPKFQAYVDKWLADGVVFEWANGWSDDPKTSAKADGYPRYAGTSGMTAVSKALAQNIDVRLACQVEKITAVSQSWHIHTEQGDHYESKALLLTPPVPQSLALLSAGQTALEPADAEALAQVRYAPCVAGLFLVDGAVNLPEPGAIQRQDHTFRWLANNQRKGISPEAQLITVHANTKLSWELWDESQENKVAALLEGLRPFLDPSATIKTAQAHRWRYAQPINLYPERTLLAKNHPPLAFAGDGFKEPRVEGAALSGLAAGETLNAAVRRDFR